MPRFLFFVFFLLPTAYCLLPLSAQAQSAGDSVATLQAQIAQYQQQLNALGTQKKTLQSAIATLTLEQKQLAAQIQLTKSKITAASSQISQLTASIGDKESTIASDQEAIGSALRSISEGEQAPLIEELFSAQSLGDAWNAIDETSQFSNALNNDIADLQKTRTALSNSRATVTTTKNTLLSLQTQLNTQNNSLTADKKQQQALLAQTNNSETTYQKLLAQAQAELASFSTFAQNAGGSGILTNQTVCDTWGCYYNQRDSAWGNVLLNGTSDRMAADGCLVTSMAMVLTHYGYSDVNPLTINSNPANFSVVGGYMLYTTYFDDTSATRAKESVTTKAIDTILASGNPAIVGLHAYGGTHFVVLVSGQKGSYVMRDPYIANGKDISFSANYSVGNIYEVNKVVVSS